MAASKDQVLTDDCGDAELEKLEAEVEELADRLFKLRKTRPSLFMDKLEALLVSTRPAILDPQVSSAQFQSEDKSTFPEESLQKRLGISKLLTAEEEEQDTTMQIVLLKSRIAANAASMPALLERMKVCIEKINKLDQYNDNIDYVFTKKLTHYG